MHRSAENNVNYQLRARDFHVGDVVVPYGLQDSQSGRVTAVYPGIGMVDIEFATGNKRFPAEDLMLYSSDPKILPPTTDSSVAKTANLRRVVALYWTGKDRKYKVTRSECGQQAISCPRCPESQMRKTTYTRGNGKNEHLMGCPVCLFLIRFEDIQNHWLQGT